MENICRFIPLYPSADNIHILNFVLETQKMQLLHPEESAGYRLFFVSKGTGRLKTNGKITPVSENDIFFTFPGRNFSIEFDGEFSCMYINFLGGRANIILDRLGVTLTAYHFPSFPELRDFWETAIHSFENSLDLISESVLLFTFSALAERKQAESGEPASPGTTKMIRQIKKYLDENYADPELSLKSVAAHFSYNKAYLSSTFKKQMKTSFSNYLNVVRCRHACRLLEHEFTSTQEIALLCGYTDPMYFSKVFRQKMGVSPRDYRAGLQKNK
ncbi:MAG: AraC family transcriptional regulator [Ruminococcaceae bacterium]|nr:AraC family transcriptional regulator [Oscillospiraceae bacterium]